MKRSTKIAAILTGLVMTVTTVAMAQGMGMGGGSGMGMGKGNMQSKGKGMGGAGGCTFLLKMVQNDRVVQELGLSDSQVGNITAISETSAAEVKELREQMLELRAEFQELIKADSPNVSKIDSNIDQTGDLMTRMQKAQVHAMIDAFNVLTPEQQDKVKTFMKSRGQGRNNGGRGRGQGFQNRGGGMGNGMGAGQGNNAYDASEF